jgi:hypothetical protein
MIGITNTLSNGGRRVSCEVCRNVIEQPDVPHVVRSCSACGREMRVVEPGAHGKGIQVRKGDRFVIPAGFIKIAANPLKATGRLYRPGLDWFASLIFVDNLPAHEKDYVAEATRLEAELDSRINTLVAPLDINDPEHIQQIIETVSARKGTAEFWSLWAAMFLGMARDARENNDSYRASWATACAERCRAMVVFKDHLEEVVWMGHSAKRVIDSLRIWDANRVQANEAFWQDTFNEHSYVLSQVFAVPVVFIGERAYVGGMKIDKSSAKFVDYLFSAESSREAILVEIKTPMTRLLGRPYRQGAIAPSVELSGAVVQLQAYRNELITNLKAISGEQVELQAFRPRCVLVAGDASAQLTDDTRRTSFELFRSSLDVEIITYDELFRKVEILAELFSIRRTTEDDAAESTTDRAGSNA